MPDRHKSTPPVPSVTHLEEEAQSVLKRMLQLVALLRWFLEQVHFRLPDPLEAEAMGNGAMPESLTFSLRGSIECALHDHVEPLESLLTRAVQETPEKLVRDWQERQRGGK